MAISMLYASNFDILFEGHHLYLSIKFRFN